MSKKYEESGVSLQRGYDVVDSIKKMIPRTFNMGVMSTIGDFGGLFDLSAYNIAKPVLVSGTDGVGTKLLIAQSANQHDTIGIDLVAMCVNDVLTIGANPLYFLDYVATGTIQPHVLQEVVSGIVTGCEDAGCALIGGETAEMPDMYQEGHYDLAGFTTAVVDKDKMIQKSAVKEGDVLIGLASSGIHSNGYSLVRKLFFKDHNYSLSDYIPELGSTLQQELLKPTKIYVKPVLDVLQHFTVHSMSHITGGGFYENIPRAIPESLGVTIHQGTWTIPPIFTLMQSLGEISLDEMFHIFNMGIGMVLVVDKEDVKSVLELLHNQNCEAAQIGVVTTKEGVHFE